MSEQSESAAEAAADEQRQQESDDQAASSRDNEPSSSDEELSPEEAHAAVLSDWRTAAVVHFTRCFGEVLGMARPFPAEKLEDALEQPTEHLMFLGELVHRLVTSKPYAPDAAEAAWPLLQQAAKSRLGMQPNLDFFGLSPLKRVKLLYNLCEWRLENDMEFREHTRRAELGGEPDAGELRAEALGRDARGARYFFLAVGWEDCRLYREEPPPRARRDRKPSGRADTPKWEVACSSIEEITELTERLSGSRNKAERALRDAICDGVLPELLETVAARKRASERLAAIEAAPRKRSSRLQDLEKQRREEERAAEAAATRRAEQAARAAEKRRVQEKESRALRLLQYNQQREQAALEYQMKAAGLKDGPSRAERMQQRQGTTWTSVNGSSHSAGPSSDSEGDVRQPNGAQHADGRQPDDAQQHDQHANGVNGSGRPRRSNAGQHSQRLADAQAEELRRHAAARDEHTSSPLADGRAKTGMLHGAVQAPVKASAPLPELPPDFQPSRSTRSGRAGAVQLPLPRHSANHTAGWSPLGVSVPRGRRRGRRRHPRRDLRQLEAVAGWATARSRPRSVPAALPAPRESADPQSPGRRQSKRQRTDGVAAERLQQQDGDGRAAQHLRGDSSAAAAQSNGLLHGDLTPQQYADAHPQTAAWQHSGTSAPQQLPNGTRQSASRPGAPGHQHGMQQPQQQQQQEHMAAQSTTALPPPMQQQAAESLMGQLPPEHRAALARMPPAQQAAALQTLRQRMGRQQLGPHPDSQVHAAQQMLLRQLVARLPPQERMRLQQLPQPQRSDALHQLLRQHAEQARQQHAQQQHLPYQQGPLQQHAPQQHTEQQQQPLLHQQQAIQQQQQGHDHGAWHSGDSAGYAQPTQDTAAATPNGPVQGAEYFVHGDGRADMKQQF